MRLRGVVDRVLDVPHDAFHAALDLVFLALMLELLHLLDSLLDRSNLVQAMAVVEIDVLHTEALQRALAC